MTLTTIDARTAHPDDPTPQKIRGGLLDPAMLWRSTPAALRKLDPAHSGATR